MKKNITLLFISFIITIILNSNVFAKVILRTPEDVKTEELNKEEREKLQNVQYTETLEIPNQYKGKLKYTEGTEDVYLEDAKLFFGMGGRYTFSHNVTLESNRDISSMYFNKKNTFNMRENYNYFMSAGLYWRNGIRIEGEYSKMTLTTKDYGKHFNKFTTQSGDIIFNQYLQKTGVLNTIYLTPGDSENKYTTLTNNMLPKLDLEVTTYMVNVIFEKSNIKSKLRPYLGFGIGLVQGDFITLASDGASKVMGGQVMTGLSYPITENQVILYFGYRCLFSQTMEQTFTRITGVSLDNVPEIVEKNYAFTGKVYYNPNLVESKERFNFLTHNIDIGVKFFF